MSYVDLTDFLVTDSSNNGAPVEPVALEAAFIPAPLFWCRDEDDGIHTTSRVLIVDFDTDDDDNDAAFKLLHFSLN